MRPDKVTLDSGTPALACFSPALALESGFTFCARRRSRSHRAKRIAACTFSNSLLQRQRKLPMHIYAPQPPGAQSKLPGARPVGGHIRGCAGCLKGGGSGESAGQDRIASHCGRLIWLMSSGGFGSLWFVKKVWPLDMVVVD